MTALSYILGWCHRWFDLNRRLCGRIARHLPQARFNIFHQYELMLAELMNAAPDQVILDVGGGRACRFARCRTAESRIKIVASDISWDELQHNGHADSRVVANAAGGLPFRASSLSMVTSRALLEHVNNLESFATDAFAALQPGGYFVHVFACRFAPFAVINRILHHSLSQKILLFFYPGVKDACGFPAVYERCYYSAVGRLLAKQGFSVQFMRVGYFQSGYFSFFVPLFVASALYEMLLERLGLRNLGAYLLIVARKP